MLVTDAAIAIEKLRMAILFGDDESDPPELPPESESHYLAALAMLDCAQRSMTLANYCRAQGR